MQDVLRQFMAIISFRYNFIFLKTRKTAGTSIEIDLSQIIEDDAIVTPISPPAAGHRPRNYSTASDGDYYNHMSAVEIRTMLGAEVFDGMYKFCLEREPVSKCISHFHMQRNSQVHNPQGLYQSTWHDYCEAREFPLDVEKYCEWKDDAWVPMVDRVLMYERLEWDLPDLLRTLGLPDFRLNARAKADYSQNRLVRPEEVTGQQRRLIYQSFSASCRVTGLYLDAVEQIDIGAGAT